MEIVENLSALLAVAVVVYGLCWLHIRAMPEPAYDLPRWWYLLWLVWLPRLRGRGWRR